MVQKGLLALGLLALVMFLPRLVARLRGGGGSVGWVDAAKVGQRLQQGDGLVIVDVRGRDEFEGTLGHIPGARNIPLPEFPRRCDELAWCKEREVVLVCRTQMRSAEAAGLLRDAGFLNVAILRGGMVEWNRCGLPMAREAAK